MRRNTSVNVTWEKHLIVIGDYIEVLGVAPSSHVPFIWHKWQSKVLDFKVFVIMWK